MRAIDLLRRCFAAGLLLASWLPASAAEPALHLATPQSDEVLDLRAGLAWARCAEGQHWDGRACAGAATRMDHGHALAAARVRSQASGQAWRLPRAAELRQLGRQWAAAQALSPRAFPASPEGWHWSSSTTVNTGAVNQYDYGNIRSGVTEQNVARLSFLHGLAVQLPGGEVDSGVLKRERLPVRLVRTLAPSD
ncbi:MAG: DUF1566 domain-containing protein [Vitreoscilla sp.]|nr:DUF1566 domain-containing protein [Vitreoscilla sp.]